MITVASDRPDCVTCGTPLVGPPDVAYCDDCILNSEMSLVSQGGMKIAITFDINRTMREALALHYGDDGRMATRDEMRDHIISSVYEELRTLCYDLDNKEARQREDARHE
jgi:hypothetical protein